MDQGKSGKLMRTAAYLAPLVLIFVLIGLYAAAPQFYLAYVLESKRREYQAVEIVTFACAIAGSLFMFIAARRLWRQDIRPVGKKGRLLRDRGGFVVIAVMAMATFFFAGEEISWGQTYLGWGTPEAYKSISGETNLHNTPLNVKSIGDWFLVAVCFVLPGLWAMRGRWCPPASWSPGIAEGPVVFAMAVAFVWRLYKNIYRQWILDVAQEQDVYYMQFIEQINEHKEMLAAVSLLMYGLYRLSAVRRYLAGQPQKD